MCDAEPRARDDADVAPQAAVAVASADGSSSSAASTPLPRADHHGRLSPPRADRGDVFRIEAQLELGERPGRAGRTDEARVAYEAARVLAEEKGGVVILAAVLRRLEELDAAPE